MIRLRNGGAWLGVGRLTSAGKTDLAALADFLLVFLAGVAVMAARGGRGAK